MRRFVSACLDEAMLQEFLENRLNAQKELRFSSHLEECERCRNSLHALAGDLKLGSETRRNLSNWLGTSDRASSRFEFSESVHQETPVQTWIKESLAQPTTRK